MNTVTKIYYERLVSHGNYENTRFGVEVACGPSLEDCENSITAAKAIVDHELSKEIGRKQLREEESQYQLNVEHLKQEREQLLGDIRTIQDWMKANDPFVRAFEAASGQCVGEVPF